MKYLEGIRIRKALTSDLPGILSVVKNAFEHMLYSDQTETELVKCLVNSDSYISSLSLVAELDTKIVGHILLSKIQIEIVKSEPIASLALAPLSVEPMYQKKGIGTQLIHNAHSIALDEGYHSVTVVGNDQYYSKFGYRPSTDFNIRLPFDIPEKYCMILELIPHSLDNISGVASYSSCFQAFS